MNCKKNSFIGKMKKSNKKKYRFQLISWNYDWKNFSIYKIYSINKVDFFFFLNCLFFLQNFSIKKKCIFLDWFEKIILIS